MKKISKRDKEMVRLYATDPKITKTKAYQQTHTVREDTQLDSIYTQASDAFRKPEVRSELSRYNSRVEEVMITTVDEWGNHEKPRQREIAIDTAKFIHDKIHGKATQKIESKSTSVNLNLDLTSLGEEQVAV